MSEKENYQDMTNRDILIRTETKVEIVIQNMSMLGERLSKLETDHLTFKTEINAKIKVYTAIATAISTAVGSLVMHFLK